MPIELTLLVASTGLYALYIGVQSTLYRLQHGVRFAASGRDDESAPNRWNQRADKALRNLQETYPVFLALAVAAALGRGDELSLWAARSTSSPGWSTCRSTCWRCSISAASSG